MKGGVTVLIADDHEIFSWALKSTLDGDGSFRETRVVSNLPDALEQLALDPEISLLCLDMHMPGMAGADSIVEIRKTYPCLRIAVVTSSTDRSDVIRVLDAGVNGFIPKTLKTPEIKQALQAILDGQIYVPSLVSSVAYQSPPSEERPILFERPRNPASARAKWVVLTARQREVAELLSSGLSNKEIGKALGLAEGTVKIHVAALLRALDVQTRGEAASRVRSLRDHSETEV